MAGEPDRIMLSSSTPDTGWKLNLASARRLAGTVFRALTQPAPSVQGREARERARTGSALLLTTVLNLGTGAFLNVDAPDALVIGTIAMVVLYALSRTRFYVASFYLSVVTLYVPSVAWAFNLPVYGLESVTAAFAWMMLPVLLAGVLLPLWNLGVVVVGNMVLLGVLPSLVPDLEPVHVTASYGLVGSVAIFSLVVARLQQRRFEGWAREEQRMQSALDEKEVLLKEIHHRVKNNLQIVSSLLSLQASSADDRIVSDALQNCQDRVQTIALIHEHLYQAENLVHLDFGTYVRALAAGLVASQSKDPGDITLNVAIDNVYLGPDEAILCGLIVNELVTNALKHGFPNGGKGEVNVAMHRAGDDVELSICNDGLPFPDDVNILQVESLGLHLVLSVVNQLGGTLSLTTGDCTCFTITCRADVAHWKGV